MQVLYMGNNTISDVKELQKLTELPEHEELVRRPAAGQSTTAAGAVWQPDTLVGDPNGWRTRLGRESARGAKRAGQAGSGRAVDPDAEEAGRGVGGRVAEQDDERE